MTIIQPHKTAFKANFLIFMLMMSAIAAALWGIFLYNRMVDLRHEIKKREGDFSRAEVINAELKNNLYSIIDAENLELLKNSQSLILDKNPVYVKLANKLTMNHER